MVSQWLRGVITTTHKHPRQVHHSEGSQTEDPHIHWELLLFQCRRKTGAADNGVDVVAVCFLFCSVFIQSSFSIAE